MKRGVADIEKTQTSMRASARSSSEQGEGEAVAAGEGKCSRAAASHTSWCNPENQPVGSTEGEQQGGAGYMWMHTRTHQLSHTAYTRHGEQHR